MRRVLILGGTTEATALARSLAGREDIAATLSLAGRTRTPAPQALPTRVGGFGGIDGLRDWLRENAITHVIDATHPFAAQMSAHALAACAVEGVNRARFTRPPWRAHPGDRWTDVADAHAAVLALGREPRRVFLPMGRGSLQPFAAAPWHHYTVRSIDPPADMALMPNHRVVLGRPPFAQADEEQLLRQAAIEVIVTKNSGGDSAASKLLAARALSLPVIMIAQPAPPPGPLFYAMPDVLDFLRSAD